MRQRIITAFTCIVILLTANLAFSQVRMGGYDVLKIQDGVITLLRNKFIISDQDIENIKTAISSNRAASGIMISGVPVLSVANELASVLVGKGFISKAEMKTNYEEASKSGGVKLGGYNIIVLYAGILNSIVRTGLVNIAEAQAVLDEAKK